MKNSNCTYCNSEDFVSKLLLYYESISERLNELREMREQFKCDIYDEIYYMKYSKLFNTIYNDLIKLFIAEEDFLFPELKNVLPDSSSIRAIKVEQEEASLLCNSIHNCLISSSGFKQNREIVEVSIIKLENLLERIIHKKNIMLHHEALVLLDSKTLEVISENLQKAEVWNNN